MQWVVTPDILKFSHVRCQFGQPVETNKVVDPFPTN